MLVALMYLTVRQTVLPRTQQTRHHTPDVIPLATFQHDQPETALLRLGDTYSKM
jgi:hypothetical protein